jgi:hypothetical protein
MRSSAVNLQKQLVQKHENNSSGVLNYKHEKDSSDASPKTLLVFLIPNQETDSRDWRKRRERDLYGVVRGGLAVMPSAFNTVKEELNAYSTSPIGLARRGRDSSIEEEVMWRR